MILVLLNLLACAAVVARAVCNINTMHLLAEPVQALRMIVLAAGAFAAGLAPLFGWVLTAPAVGLALATAVVVVTHRRGR